MRHAIRAADRRTFPGGLYASADDLLRKIDLLEFSTLIKFVVASLNATAQETNANAWPAGRHGLELELMGVWFQIQNGGWFTTSTPTATARGQAFTTFRSTRLTSDARILSSVR